MADNSPVGAPVDFCDPRRLPDAISKPTENLFSRCVVGDGAFIVRFTSFCERARCVCAAAARTWKCFAPNHGPLSGCDPRRLTSPDHKAVLSAVHRGTQWDDGSRDEISRIQRALSVKTADVMRCGGNWRVCSIAFGLLPKVSAPHSS